MLHGLDVMLRDWDDTRLIAYLATNSCSGNKLSLKDQAQSFAGNYAQSDIKDIRKIPLPQLLQYNLVDCLSTWFVYERHWDRMVRDQQLPVYNEIFKPAVKDIIQMQLTGMPINMQRVIEVKGILQADNDKAVAAMAASPLIQRFEYQLREEHVRKRNEKLKTKQITMADAEVMEVVFNPNSGPQLQTFLFDFLGLPVIGLTDSKLPSTDGDTLEALKSRTDNAEILAFLEALIDYKTVNKILTSFIPAMEEAQPGNDGWHYLFGNFNLGGTVSGRLSSSDPNLQNLPANSKLAKLIKSCFQAPPGWFFCGIDFASLEDRISALTTKDPNKLKVYIDGYDGHSLRAYAYFGDNMPDIDPNSVESINSIQDRYKPYRQDSKAPTFALTYQGTYITLMNNCGFSKEKALMVEQRYHDLYKVSDDWVARQLDQACVDGYVTVAFGMRVRTPLLKQVIRGTSKTPFEAEAEGRTAGNALGQSWCLLNSRAGSEFMNKVRQHPKHRTQIKICAQIHDANYFLVKDDIDSIMYANEHMVKACEWQDHPAIAHDEVKLGGEFSIFYPDWSKEVSLPNNATEAQIYEAFEKHIEKIGKNP
jgi:DNA polymerase-1